MIQRVEAGRNLAAGVVSDLGATISEQIARGVKSIHMDASRVVEFDSSSLEALLDFDAKVTSRGVTFVLTDPSEVLRTALRITGLQDQLEIGEASEPPDQAQAQAQAQDAGDTVVIGSIETVADSDPAELGRSGDSVGTLEDADPGSIPVHPIESIEPSVPREPGVRPEGVDE